MFRKLFLPGGMIVALILALAAPMSGSWIKSCGLQNWLIIMIFFVCGLQTPLQEFRFDRKFFAGFFWGLPVTLIVAPLVTALLVEWGGIESMAGAGLIVMAAVPPTLSSGIVMATNAGGNAVLAMMVTIGYSVIGIFTLPPVLGWTLANAEGVHLDPWGMLRQLILLVIVPFAASILVRKLLEKILKKVNVIPGWFHLLPSIGVILLILGFFATSHDLLLATPVMTLLLAAGGSVVLHIILLVTLWFGAKWIRIGRSDRIAIIFTGGSKTLTIALTVLSIIGIAEGTAILPCLVFYFVQMLFDSALSAKLFAIGQSSVLSTDNL